MNSPIGTPERHLARSAVETASSPRRYQSRAARVAEKRALRQSGLKASQAIPFAEMAADPLYRRIAAATCPEALKADLVRFGLENAAEVAACNSLSGLNRRLSRRAGEGEAPGEATQAFFDRARGEAIRGYRLTRHMLAVKDPMNLGLRHTSSDLPAEMEQVVRSAGGQVYARPSSLQSSQSPAAYLRYLYRIAMGLNKEIGITPPEPRARRLEMRRPDLARLVLSETSLKQEIATIELVDEVLAAGLGEIDIRTTFYPIALPFDEQASVTRAALARIGGTTLNDIAARTSRSVFPLRADVCLASDQAGLLGLTGAVDEASGGGSEIALLTEDTDIPPESHPTTLGGLYHVTNELETSTAVKLMSRLDLDFDRLVQLLGLYVVHQENGRPVAQKDYATSFLDNKAPFQLITRGGHSYVYLNSIDVAPPELRGFNYLARLHHATGLDFHHLNWLLACPGASEAGNPGAAWDRVAPRHLTATGLRVLAGYRLYRDAFDLGPEAYAALFGEICPFWRADMVAAGSEGVTPGLEQTEISFLRTLFGEDATALHQMITEAATPIDDTGLADMVCRGLRLSAVELDALVDALDADFALKMAVDARGLGALYRLATVFRIIGWPLLSGLRLVTLVSGQSTPDNQLLRGLTVRNETADGTARLCTALDQIIELARWMTEAELTPDALLALLTPATTAGPRASDADRRWLGDLAAAVAPVLGRADSFRGFETWDSRDAPPVTIPAEAWHQHMRAAGALYRGTGVFHPGMDRAAMSAICRDFLRNGHAVDPDLDGNAVRLERLLTLLEKARDAQALTFERALRTFGTTLTASGAGALVIWAQTTSLDALDALLAGADDDNALLQLQELRRHAAAIDALALGDVDLQIIAWRPDWLAPEAADIGPDRRRPRALCLEQLVACHRFATLQVGAATDDAWLGYLTVARDGRPGTAATAEDLTIWRTACKDMLAILLGCPAVDVPDYLAVLAGPDGVADDLVTIDAVARHARLAEDLRIGGPDLVVFGEVSSPRACGDWMAAATAAQAGLARFKGGSQMAGFRRALAEVKRDALVAAYMCTTIAADPDLAAEVTDREALYGHLLLDVQVTSAVPTSRLIEASSALQLYISRALNGLERGVGFVDRPALAAEWRLNRYYRQWEANQKLLLYPQNYIEPELRQITSPEFDDLLRAISGGDVSEDGVEAAVNAYMTGLAGCCDLSLCSTYVERGGKSTPGHAIYHFLATAHWESGRFFYRKLEADYTAIAALADPSQYLKALDWTFWQEVTVPKTHDLLSDVTLCFFLNRYYLFWLEIEERKGQTSDSDAVSWRIHPRYMRCDANALTGATHVPGLFIDGDTAGGDGALMIDGAFHWQGQKPRLKGTYQPLGLSNVFSYGVLAADAVDGESGAVLVSFGVSLAGDPMVDDPQTVRQTVLHMRLTEKWADAILVLDDDIDTMFQDAAPAGYKSIYPRIAAEDPVVADQYTVANTYVGAQFLGNYYDLYRPAGQNVSLSVVINYGESKDVTVTTNFSPSPLGSSTLGTVRVNAHLGHRRYLRRVYNSTAQDGSWTALRETRPAEIHMKMTMTYEVPGAPPKTSESDWLGGPTAPYKDDFPDMPFKDMATAETEHIRDETIEGIVALPSEWSFGTATNAVLTVNVTIRIIPSDLVFSLLVKGEPVNLACSPTSDVSYLDAFAGKFNLRPAEGKSNTGWALGNAHGSHNFVHIMDREDTPNAGTFLLLNASPALRSLTETMPRPGGCASLFTAGNQALSEDLGSFVEAFGQTLREVYPKDATSLDPARTPAPLFDFDGAYGGYGWEIFYHIPSTLAAGYVNDGQYDKAIGWLEKIFDPDAGQPWRVAPLIGATMPANYSAFDTGDVIVDPDRIATDYPFYYQQAAIRHYLEAMLADGDAAYEQQSQETLQQAKAIYVAAKQIFNERLPEILDAVTNRPWTNPTLGEVSVNGYGGFLPPYNQALRDLYDAIEARLANLRQWLDIDGNPLNVPLLSAPIDPRALQKAAKAALTLGQRDSQEEAEQDPRVDFTTLARSAKLYIGNLQTTSNRLLAALEKLDGATVGRAEKDVEEKKILRSAAIQDLTLAAADKEVQIKQANLGGANSALAFHLGSVLVSLGALNSFAAIDAGKKSVEFVYNKSKLRYDMIRAVAFSSVPNIFGLATGGQRAEQGAIANILGMLTSEILYDSKKSAIDKYKESGQKLIDQMKNTTDLTTKVASASLELQKAKDARDEQSKKREALDADLADLEDIRTVKANSFANLDFYKWLVDDLKSLFEEEWATTQDFCKLLVRLYEYETEETDGASFIKTTSFGGDYQRLNAPYWLALDVERLEAAYFRSVLDHQSQSATMRVAISELPAPGGDGSALTTLIEQGETYFDLTDEMFDALYPGQYDRRIQSLRVRFPGLESVGLSPHARLTQIANTRYATRERDPRRGGRIRKDRYALQSIVISTPTIDTATLAYPEGSLKRFQNTGVSSRWHLVLPTVLELRRHKNGAGRTRAWHDAATRHVQALRPHLDDVVLEVTFSGRW
ncbi:MAG: toxin complex protein [Tistrella sp.]|nr:toxin complex protein [Tistrella sp.]